MPIDPDQSAVVQPHGTTVSTPSDSAGLQIQMHVGPDYPNAEFLLEGGGAWDWGKFGAMVLRIENPGSEPAHFLMRIDDDAQTHGGTVHSKTGSAVAPPGRTSSFVLNFSAGADPMAVEGMRGGPPVAQVPGAIELVGGGSIEPGHVSSLQIFMDRPAHEAKLVVRSITLIALPPSGQLYDRIVDAFGQYAKADWPGKIHDEQELKAAAQTEAAHLAAAPALPDRDRFGGWAAGPSLPESGFFTTRNIDGRWWLVDPDGKLFFSNGVCTVDWRGWGTVVSGREKMFTWLPDEGDPLARFFEPLGHIHSGPVSSGKAYSFYAANLYRKDGEDFETRWEQRTIARFKSWGLNTLGNWSSVELEQLHGLPYTATLGIGGHHQSISGGEDYWGTMHDPFDPQFAADAEASVREMATRIKNDPWCVGYFVDNELSWSGGPGPDGGHYALAYSALIADAASAAKMEFVAQLKQKYGTAGKLAEAWGQKIETWDVLEKPWHPDTAAPNEAMKQDLAAFVELLAVKYFSVVREALRKFDANHLYLGCRFANATPEVIRAAARVCDVISFNVYQPKLAEAQWAFTKELGKPCMIGEFHVGSTDRGMFHPGLVPAADQQERARIYRQFVESVADKSAFVGCHWFDYVDEPLTGRAFDGENYNIGFVTVTDTPYPEMVAAVKQVGAGLYPRRAASHE
jgi:hypothetical protein